MIDTSRVRESLSGPVMSIKMPFLRNGDIDYAGIRKQIDWCIANGSKTVLLTHGDSLYSVLSDREIAEVTRVTAEHTAGRALVVAADRHWWTGQEIEFAQYARSVGVDILMVMPPDWAGSCSARSMADHYMAVAAHIPVMVVTNVFSRSSALGLDVLRLLRDEEPNVVAVKDDLTGAFARDMTLLVKDKMAVLSGGAKQHHLAVYPYGCNGSFSTFIHFMPRVTWEYWRAIEAGDVAKAAVVIAEYELPFFSLIMAQPGGWNAGLYGVLEAFGYLGRWRRPPYYSLNDAEMEHLTDVLKAKGWL